MRPVLARIRKSLFDILRPRLEGARLLDLYAGSGVVGIEALSRGAASVVFVDRNPSCLSVIRQNLSRLGMQDKARVVRADATQLPFGLGGPFDLVFMGPPYHDEHFTPFHLTGPTLRAVARIDVLAPEAWVVGQHHKKENLVIPPGWDRFREEIYGDTRLSFFVRAAEKAA